jgi:hypothetical protein
MGNFCAELNDLCSRKREPLRPTPSIDASSSSNGDLGYNKPLVWCSTAVEVEDVGVSVPEPTSSMDGIDGGSRLSADGVPLSCWIPENLVGDAGKNFNARLMSRISPKDESVAAYLACLATVAKIVGEFSGANSLKIRDSLISLRYVCFGACDRLYRLSRKWKDDNYTL